MVPSLAALAGLLDIDGTVLTNLDPLVDRDRIKAVIAKALLAHSTSDWLARLQPADIWCAEVLDWPALRAHPVWTQLNMQQTLHRDDFSMQTLRGPLRINGQGLGNGQAAPALGADTEQIIRELAVPAMAPG